MEQKVKGICSLLFGANSLVVNMMTRECGIKKRS